MARAQPEEPHRPIGQGRRRRVGDKDGDPADGMVWGYLVPASSLPAWSVKWGWDSTNPFAPLVIVLVK